MKITISLVFCAYFLFSLPAFAQNPADDAEWEKIRAMKPVYEQAVVTGKLEDLLPLLSKDFSVTTLTAESLKGFEQFKAYRDKIWTMMGQGGTYQTSIAYKPGYLFGDVAVADGTTQDKVVTSSGRTFDFSSQWTAVFTKEGGAWKIFKIHASMDPLSNDFIKMDLKRSRLTYGLSGLVLGIILAIIFCKRRSRAATVN